MIDVIKEYLVSLGMAVDKKSFDEATQTMAQVEKGTNNAVASMSKGFVAFGVAAAGAIASVTLGVGAFLGSLAKAELENEKFARQMWMSKDAAAELNNTLKAMNATVEDLYLSPELMRNFHELRATIKDMKPPPEFQNQMKFIRSIQFEFQRMRLEGTYALKWIGFYLFKYLEGPIKNIKSGLKGFNDAIIKNMPRWTKNVAQFLSWIVRLGIAMAKGGRDLLRMFGALGDRIPQSIKLIGAALLGLALILKTGPLGIIFALLTSVLLLLDDFYTYLEGGESALGPLWKKLQDFYKMLQDTGVIKRFGDGIETAFRKVESGLKEAWNWLVRLYKKFEENGTIANFREGIETNFGTAKQVIKDFSNWVGEVFDNLNKEGVLSELELSFVRLGKEISESYKAIAKFVEKTYGLKETQEVLKLIGDYIEGKLKFALETINDTLATITFTLKSARAFLTGDDKLQEEANREFFGEERYEKGTKSGLRNMSDAHRFRPTKEQGTTPPRDTRLEASVNNLPKGIEPSFKKALNESEVAKGLRTFNQDLNKGFELLARMINPDAFNYYQAMAAGTYSNSYLYNSMSNQTIIKNENKPAFYINSNDAKGVAREVEQTWTGMNIRNMRSLFG